MVKSTGFCLAPPSYICTLNYFQVSPFCFPHLSPEQTFPHSLFSLWYAVSCQEWSIVDTLALEHETSTPDLVVHYPNYLHIRPLEETSHYLVTLGIPENLKAGAAAVSAVRQITSLYLESTHGGREPEIGGELRSRSALQRSGAPVKC